MSKYEFVLNNCDTDSIMFNKPDGSPFSDEEINRILSELNAEYPEHIKFDNDGYFETVIIFKAKNYIMYDGKKLKSKGSALKSSKAEVAMKELQQEIIWAIINDTNDYSEIYHRYVKEASAIKDITRWTSKKTVTAKVFSSPRANETKIVDALVGSEYVEGDKILLFFKKDGTLCLSEKFDGEYDEKKLYEKLFKSMQIFASVLPTKELFPNYSLKKNLSSLADSLNR